MATSDRNADGGIFRARARLGQALSIALVLPLLAHCAETNDAGLVVTYRTANAPASVDITISPNVALFVQQGKPPSPFLPAGKFTATWEGNISAELRSEFSFQADLNGELKLEIGGKVAYEAQGAGTATALGKPVQLNKGANSFRAVYTSPNKGDALLRLWWTEKPPYTSPIPLSVLTHESSPELSANLQRHLGRELFLEFRCFNCHKTGIDQASLPELNMDAPLFEGIGARRNYEWMARWILDPGATRASVHMPKLLTGPTAKEDAKAMAAYLASLKAGGEVSISEPKIKSKPTNLADAEQSEPEKNLFERLNCVACHNPLEGEADPGKISLKHVAQKFPAAKLAEFLRAPEAHFAWIRMPNFHLSSKESTELAALLISKADKQGEEEAGPSAGNEARGRTLVQETGCLNCHKLNLENKFSAPSLKSLNPDKWTKGCLATKPTTGSKAPEFAFSSAERDALKALGQTDRESLTRYVPAELAERKTRLLNCTGCHGQVEGFPPLEILGAKLRPEWAGKFIAGEIPYKPRTERHPHGEPWLEMRMPAFKSYATLLAVGLAAQHGYPPVTPEEPPIDMELAKVGQKLVGKEGGFSCISCHGVRNMEAMEVFEGEGINFAYTSDRLLPQYYRRWLRNPLAIDPHTKMPAYFEDAKSALTDVFDGDSDKQIDAMWQYFRLGPKMPLPSTGQ